MSDFIAAEDRAILAAHQLDSFEALWALELEAVDEPNTERGGKVGQAAEVVQDCGIDFGLRHGRNLPVLDLGFGP